MSIQRHVMQLFVGQLVTKLGRPPVLVHPAITIAEACEKLRSEKIGSLVASEDNETIAGIFSERDLLMKCACPPQDLTKVFVKDLMTKNVRCIDDRQSLARAIFEMNVGGFRHLPIVDKSKKVVGMISGKAIVDYIYRQLEKIKEIEPNPKNSGTSDVETFLNSKIDILKAQKPLSVDIKEPTTKALAVLRDNHIGAVLVTEDKRLKGIFTERDFLMKSIFNTKQLAEEPVSSNMTESPSFLFAISNVEDAFGKLSKGGFRHLPVVSQANVPTGILSSRNFLNYLSTAIIDDLKNKD